MQEPSLAQGLPRLKRCTRCRRWKSLGSFGKASSQKSGLNPQCKPCRRKVRKESAARKGITYLEQYQ